ncbi:hypothetical protein PHLGIDRAFT_495533, partial [Phlebiopsis gigantea 11061_1 CR5-6]
IYLFYKLFEPLHLWAHIFFFLSVPAVLAAVLGRSLMGCLQIAVSYWAILCVIPIIYRLSPFHPLAHFPGPVLARASKLYFTYLVTRGNSYLVVIQLHQRYGEVVRIGPNELSFDKSSAIHPIYASKMTCKGPAYDTRVHFDGSVQLDGVRDPAVHSGRRKAWTKAMSPAALKGYEGIIVDKVTLLVEALSKRRGGCVDLSYWINLFGLDVMSAVVFGRELGALVEGQDTTRLIKMIEGGMKAGYILAQLPWVYVLLKCLPGSQKQLQEMQDRSHSFVNHRTSTGSMKRDLFYYLVKDGATTQHCYSKEELLGDGMLALVAGSDTTSSTLSHLFYFLLRHPECMTRLKSEVNSATQNGKNLFDFKRHTEMPYMNACINEAMRLFPAVSGLLQRRLQTAGGVQIDSHYVPNGTILSVHIYSLHRNAAEFSPIPDTFWPDRWLDQDTYILPNGDTAQKASIVLNRAAFIPFSTGPQNCAGKALPLLELRAVVCAIVASFDIGKDATYNLDSWEINIRDFFVTLRGPLFVRIDVRHRL